MSASLPVAADWIPNFTQYENSGILFHAKFCIQMYIING